MIPNTFLKKIKYTFFYEKNAKNFFFVYKGVCTTNMHPSKLKDKKERQQKRQRKFNNMEYKYNDLENKIEEAGYDGRFALFVCDEVYTTSLLIETIAQFVKYVAKVKKYDDREICVFDREKVEMVPLHKVLEMV